MGTTTGGPDNSFKYPNLALLIINYGIISASVGKEPAKTIQTVVYFVVTVNTHGSCDYHGYRKASFMKVYS